MLSIDSLNCNHTTCLRIIASCSQVALIASSFFLGCSPPELEPPKEIKPPSRTYHVTLPPVHDLDSEVPPLKNADGTFRVDGIRMHAKHHLESDVDVSGVVVGKATCREKPGEICAKPFLWLAQGVDPSEVKLRVVDMNRRKLKRFKVGKSYRITGTFSQTSKSGYGDSRGVLRFKSYKAIK